MVSPSTATFKHAQPTLEQATAQPTHGHSSSSSSHLGKHPLEFATQPPPFQDDDADDTMAIGEEDMKGSPRILSAARQRKRPAKSSGLQPAALPTHQLAPSAAHATAELYLSCATALYNVTAATPDWPSDHALRVASGLDKEGRVPMPLVLATFLAVERSDEPMVRLTLEAMLRLCEDQRGANVIDILVETGVYWLVVDAMRRHYQSRAVRVVGLKVLAHLATRPACSEDMGQRGFCVGYADGIRRYWWDDAEAVHRTLRFFNAMVTSVNDNKVSPLGSFTLCLEWYFFIILNLRRASLSPLRLFV